MSSSSPECDFQLFAEHIDNLDLSAYPPTPASRMGTDSDESDVEVLSISSRPVSEVTNSNRPSSARSDVTEPFVERPESALSGGTEPFVEDVDMENVAGRQSGAETYEEISPISSPDPPNGSLPSERGLCSIAVIENITPAGSPTNSISRKHAEDHNYSRQSSAMTQSTSMDVESDKPLVGTSCFATEVQSEPSLDRNSNVPSDSPPAEKVDSSSKEMPIDASGKDESADASVVDRDDTAAGIDVPESPRKVTPSPELKHSVKCVLCESELIKKGDMPKLLRCLHSCCSGCMESEMKRVNRVVCKECSVASSRADIIDNRILLESVWKDNGKDKMCTACDEPEVASLFCSTCDDRLCEACVKAHKRVKATRSHTLSPLDLNTVGVPPLCSVHKQEKLTLFCEFCKDLTCRNCQLEAHRNHSYKFIDEIAVTVKKSLEEDLEVMENRQDMIDDCLNKLEEKNKAVDESGSSAEQDIADLKDQIQAALVERCKELQESLQGILSEQKKGLDDKKETILAVKKSVEKGILFGQMAMDASALSLVYSQNFISNQISELKVMRVEEPDDKLTTIRTNYSNLSRVREDMKLLGSVEAYHLRPNEKLPERHDADVSETSDLDFRRLNASPIRPILTRTRGGWGVKAPITSTLSLAPPSSAPSPAPQHRGTFPQNQFRLLITHMKIVAASFDDLVQSDSLSDREKVVMASISVTLRKSLFSLSDALTCMAQYEPMSQYASNVQTLLNTATEALTGLSVVAVMEKQTAVREAWKRLTGSGEVNAECTSNGTGPNPQSTPQSDGSGAAGGEQRQTSIGNESPVALRQTSQQGSEAPQTAHHLVAEVSPQQQQPAHLQQVGRQNYRPQCYQTVIATSSQNYTSPAQQPQQLRNQPYTPTSLPSFNAFASLTPFPAHMASVPHANGHAGGPPTETSYLAVSSAQPTYSAGPLPYAGGPPSQATYPSGPTSLTTYSGASPSHSTYPNDMRTQAVYGGTPISSNPTTNQNGRNPSGSHIQRVSYYRQGSDTSQPPGQEANRQPPTNMTPAHQGYPPASFEQQTQRLYPETHVSDLFKPNRTYQASRGISRPGAVTPVVVTAVERAPMAAIPQSILQEAGAFPSPLSSDSTPTREDPEQSWYRLPDAPPTPMARSQSPSLESQFRIRIPARFQPDPTKSPGTQNGATISPPRSPDNSDLSQKLQRFSGSSIFSVETRPASSTDQGGVSSSEVNSSGDTNEEMCKICHDGGEIICCDFCPRSYHSQCHVPPIKTLSENAKWQCNLCKDLRALEAQIKRHYRGYGMKPRQRAVAYKLIMNLHSTWELSKWFRNDPFDENGMPAPVLSETERDYRCLFTLKDKLVGQRVTRYKSFTKFVQDVRKMFTSARLANQAPHSEELISAANKLESDYFEKYLREMAPEYLNVDAGDAGSAGSNHSSLSNISEHENWESDSDDDIGAPPKRRRIKAIEDDED